MWFYLLLFINLSVPGNQCSCNDGFMQNVDGTTCVVRVFGDDCVDDLDCSAAFNGGVCSDTTGECGCGDGYVSSGINTCVLRTIGEGSCTNTDPQCTSAVSNSNCGDGSVCVCDEGYQVIL